VAVVQHAACRSREIKQIMSGLVAFSLNVLVFSQDNSDWKGPVDLRIRFTSFGSAGVDLGPSFICSTSLLCNRSCSYVAKDQSDFSLAM